jgi:superoxide dismutase
VAGPGLPTTGTKPAVQLRRGRPEHLPDLECAPLVALDVYEHAYFLDFQTDRGSYIDAFFANLDWGVVNDWVSRYQIAV